MGMRPHIMARVVLSLCVCGAVFQALEPGHARAQARKVAARPVQYQPPTTQEPPLAGTPQTPQQPPPPPSLPAQPPVLTTPPTAVPFPGPLNGTCPPMDPPTPSVSLRVRVNACALPNQEIEYVLLVKNESEAPAHHVLVRNPVPANARFVRATPEPHQQEPELRWHLGTLEPCACREIVLVLVPLGGEDVKNCARVQFEHGQCVTTRLVRSAPVLPPQVIPPQVMPLPPAPKKDQEPPLMPPADDKDKEPPLLPPPADAKDKEPAAPNGVAAKLTLTIAGPKTQYANLPTRYLITVSNVGKAPATKLLVSSLLPEGATYVSSSNEGVAQKQQVAWLLGTLAVNDSRTVEVVLRADKAGEFCARATARADGNVTAQAELCTKFQGVSALALEMVDREDPVQVGGKTSYTIKVINQGTEAVTNVRIKAIIPPQLELTRANGPSDPPPGEKLPPPGPEGVTLQFETLPTLAPGAVAEYEVFVKALKPGDVRFKVEMSADQLQKGGPVREEESTHILPLDPPGPPQISEAKRTRVRK